ncbi:MAG: 4Fe-4S dicluster domain-containing protein [Thermodesulfobacteriota bacterium]
MSPERRILAKEHLAPFLRKLAKGHRLVAPVAMPPGDTRLAVVEDLDRTPLDLEHPSQISAKPFLFPQEEVLFTYQGGPATGGGLFVPVYHSIPTVYFALRSCDVSALLYQDVVFLHRAKDPYYARRRHNAVLISLACNTPFPHCFCNATRSGPFLEHGFDLQLTDLGDRFYVESGRRRGEEILARWPQFFRPAGPEEARAQYQLSLEARGAFPRPVPVLTACQRLARGEVPEEVWLALSARCQDCGGCAYLCPTCTCFTITDHQTSATGGERRRAWDACTFAGFTRMAGGHNPVDRRRHGIRERFSHKLLHDFRQHGRPSCVGCGRCVGICFGGVDIVRFIDLACGLDARWARLG